MYNAVDIKYSIRWPGGYGEETNFYKKEKGEKFIFGNNGNIVVNIIDIINDAVTLKFEGLDNRIFLPNGADTIQLKSNEKIYLISNVDPAPSYCIEILKIDQYQRFYIS